MRGARASCVTISNTANSVVAQGTGATATFTYSYLMPTTASAVAQIYNTVSKTVTVLATGSYNITGIGNTAGGTFSYPLDGTFLSTTQYISLTRVVPVVQETSIADQGAFAPDAIENALDYLTEIGQQLTNSLTAVIASLGTNLPPVVQTAPVIPTASTTVSGTVTLSSHATAIAGTNDTSAMTPLDTAYAVQQGGLFNYAVDSGATNSMTATLVPAPQTASISNNFRTTIRPGHTNTSTSVTLALNGGTAYTVKKAGTAGLIALAVGDIVAGVDADLILSTTDTAQILQNPLTTSNTGFPSASGLVITNGNSTTNISLTADYVTAVNSSGFATPLGVTLSVTVNCSVTGANGLDTGALANTSEYHVFAIYNPGTATWAGLASLSPTAPTLPSGYTFSVRLGCMITGGAATFLRTRQVGRDVAYIVTAATTTTALPSLVSIVNSQTRTSVTVRGTTGAGNAKLVPSTATKVKLVVSCGSPANGGMAVAPSADAGYTATAGGGGNTAPFNVASGATVPEVNFGDIVLESAAVFYTSGSTAASNAQAQVYGWTDKCNAS